jgi:membrane-bound lytic murein transglycosylase B
MMILQQATNNATLTLVLDAIESSNPETQITAEEAMKSVAEYLVSQGVEDVNKWLQENQSTGVVQQLVAREKVESTLQWIVSKAKVIE